MELRLPLVARDARRHAGAEALGLRRAARLPLPELDALVVMTTNTHDDFPELDGDAWLVQALLPAVRPAAP